MARPIPERIVREVNVTSQSTVDGFKAVIDSEAQQGFELESWMFSPIGKRGSKADRIIAVFVKVKGSP